MRRRKVYCTPEEHHDPMIPKGCGFLQYFQNMCDCEEEKHRQRQRIRRRISNQRKKRGLKIRW